MYCYGWVPLYWVFLCWYHCHYAECHAEWVLCIVMVECHYIECFYADIIVIMLNVIILCHVASTPFTNLCVFSIFVVLAKNMIAFIWDRFCHLEFCWVIRLLSLAFVMAKHYSLESLIKCPCLLMKVCYLICKEFLVCLIWLLTSLPILFITSSTRPLRYITFLQHAHSSTLHFINMRFHLHDIYCSWHCF